ncbi:MAG: cysteine desulfurase family protein [Candidatus Saccharimonadales bacterium]|jgi:cysteine desulfurase
MSGTEIYLDYAAATPLDQRVFAAMEPYLTSQYYNPSAMYDAARAVRADLEQARHRLAMAIGAKSQEIILTAGSTESINLAITGAIGQYGGRVATSRIEHSAVIETVKRLGGLWIEADHRGYVTEAAVKAVITDDVTLISIGYANNELGTVQPLRAIAQLVEQIRQDRRARGVGLPLWLHTDASQAAGLLDISVSRLGVDMMTLSAGKCYGPKQVGLLWMRAGMQLRPLIDGGGQENGLRAGTENVAGAVGFAEALSFAVAKRGEESRRLAHLRDQLQRCIEDAIPGVVVNGHPKQRVSHILHVSIPDLDGERAVFALDDRGVMAATGSACAARSSTRSHVLTAIGMSDELADGSLRLSLGRQTTAGEIERACQIITDVIKQERGL